MQPAEGCRGAHELVYTLRAVLKIQPLRKESAERNDSYYGGEQTDGGNTTKGWEGHRLEGVKGVLRCLAS